MPVIGIDLGTTNSLAAVWKDGHEVLIPNRFGSYLTPSVVTEEDGAEWDAVRPQSCFPDAETLKDCPVPVHRTAPLIFRPCWNNTRALRRRI